MLSKVLLCEIKGLKPEGKYLLARLAQCLGANGNITLTVRDLSRRFDLSVAHVSDALTTLVAGGVLASAAVPDGKGRPKKQYSLDRQFLQGLEKVELSPMTLHQTLIERLLEHEKRRRAEAPKEREDASQILAAARSRRSLGGLTAVNRLLLAVMLLHADRFGVVRDVGAAALQMMTCLSSGRLKHRIARLIDLGLIRTYVPGAAGSVLFNKTPSVYFLNLDHSELSTGTSFANVRVYKRKIGTSEADLRVANRMLSDAVRFRDDPESVAVDPIRFKHIAELFQAEPQSMYPLLQLRLESYAAYLLSKYWSRVHLLVGDEEFSPNVDAELKARIRADFSRSKALTSIDRATAVFSGNALRNSLEDELYARARDLACSIHSVFDGKPDSPMGLMDFTIVPQTGKPGAWEVELLAIGRSA